MNKVITIGREHGSGGRQIGKLIAENLGIECYDSRFITEAAKQSGINEKLFHAYNERPIDSLLYSVAMATSAIPNVNWEMRERSLPEQICRVQFDMINELAKTPCVIVGRCADSIIDEAVPKCRIFIRAELPDRIKQITQTYKVSEKNAEKLIKQTDKERASYYQYFTGRHWRDSTNYDLCINTSGLSKQEAAELILIYIAKQQGGTNIE